MKTGILAAFGLLVAACSGQVVNSTPGSSSNTYATAGLYGIGPIITCARPPCVKAPCTGVYCPPHDEFMSYGYGDNSHLSPEEQKIEKQMEAELEAEQAAASQEQAAALQQSR